MNHIYRSIWNATVGTYVAASEVSKSAGKKNRFKRVGFALKAGVAITLSAWISAALALPQYSISSVISSGSANISSTCRTLTINQKSANVALNWLRFNINAGETVAFNQPGPSSVALNRVILSEPSNILGNLTANGKVFLINPAGIVFGSGATVNVGGLVASTRDITDSNFASGQMIFSGASSASVSNNGSITANNGYVALLGARVENTGTITANSGTVVLAAGNQMTLDFMGDNLLGVIISKAGVDAMVQNGGQIYADGGQVLLSTQTANDLLSNAVNNTGLIQARTLSSSNGTIKLLAGKENGSVNVGGIFDTSSSLVKNGGYIETSAARVHVDNDAELSTLAPKNITGNWLIKTTDFTIDNQVTSPEDSSPSSMSAAALQKNLAKTNIEIAAFSNSNSTDTSNINVSADLSWSVNKLTLTAQRDVNVNAVMVAKKIASLTMNTSSTDRIDGMDGHDNGVGRVNVALETSGFIGRVDLGSSAKLTINGFAHTIIRNQEDFQAINTNLNQRFAVGNDVVLEGYFNPFGTITKPFTGIFEGLGHTVSGLLIDSTLTTDVGFFRNTFNAKIRNIGLENVGIKGLENVGALVGINEGDSADISNSYAKGSVSGNGIKIGGLVGYNKLGSITGSYAYSEVSNGDGANSTGGLVGFNEGNISRSFATGSVTAGSGSANTGGLTGSNVGMIDSSYATGMVTAGSLSSNTGGLTGDNFSTSTISNSFALGAVAVGDLSRYYGGLIGNNESSGNTVNSFYNIDKANLSNISIGGIYNRQFQDWMSSNRLGLTIANYFNVNSNGAYLIDSLQNLKDLLGFASAPGTGYKFVLTADLDLAPLPNYTIPEFAAGQFNGAGHTLSNLHINDVSSNSGIGFIGKLSTGSSIRDLGMVNLYISAVSPVQGSSQVGGLVGDNYGSINNSFVSGNVTGQNNVGGLVGFNNSYNGMIENSYSTATVDGTSNVGGLTGSNGATGVINTSYAAGLITGRRNVGALIGAQVVNESGDGRLNNNFYDTSFNKVLVGIGDNADTPGKVVGLTESNMRKLASFNAVDVEALSWDYDNTWLIYEDQTRPLLRSFLKPLTITAIDVKTYDALAYSGGALRYSSTPDMAHLFGTPNFAGNAQGAVNVGQYSLSASGLYSDQLGYNIDGVDGTLTVNKAPLTVSADNKTRYFGETNPVFTQTVSGFVNNQNISVLRGSALGTSFANASTDVGEAVINANAQGWSADNYYFNVLKEGLLTIAQLPTSPPPISPAPAPASPQPITPALLAQFQLLPLPLPPEPSKFPLETLSITSPSSTLILFTPAPAASSKITSSRQLFSSNSAITPNLADLIKTTEQTEEAALIKLEISVTTVIDNGIKMPKAALDNLTPVQLLQK